MDMCVYTSPALCGPPGEASNRSGFVGTVAAKDLRSGAQKVERLLKLKVSPLSNHPERRRRTRRWGASPPMRERRKDSSRMHHAPRLLQPPGDYLAAARCHLCVSEGVHR